MFSTISAKISVSLRTDFLIKVRNGCVILLSDNPVARPIVFVPTSNPNTFMMSIPYLSPLVALLIGKEEASFEQLNEQLDHYPSLYINNFTLSILELTPPEMSFPKKACSPIKNEIMPFYQSTNFLLLLEMSQKNETISPLKAYG